MKIRLGITGGALQRVLPERWLLDAMYGRTQASQSEGHCSPMDLIKVHWLVLVLVGHLVQ